MSRNAKVVTEEVETINEEVTTDAPVVSDEVVTEEVETRTHVEGQFVVKVNLKRNGKRYSVGDSISLEEEEAKSLIADGTVE